MQLDMPGEEVRTTFMDPLQRLDSRERKFVEGVVAGLPTHLAGTQAGYRNAKKLAYRVIRRPQVALAIQFVSEQNRKASEMTRKKVMSGFLEAVDIAKIQGDASTMVAGWREVGRMCGLYEPEKKDINVNVTAKRMIDKLETMTNDELLDYIEGEAVDITPSPEPPPPE